MSTKHEKHFKLLIMPPLRANPSVTSPLLTMYIAGSAALSQHQLEMKSRMIEMC